MPSRCSHRTRNGEADLQCSKDNGWRGISVRFARQEQTILHLLMFGIKAAALSRSGRIKLLRRSQRTVVVEKRSAVFASCAGAREIVLRRPLPPREKNAHQDL